MEKFWTLLNIVSDNACQPFNDDSDDFLKIPSFTGYQISLIFLRNKEMRSSQFNNRNK